MNLGSFADRRPHELSGGMRQRVALARAFAQDADVLLMDEPFGALDAMTRDLLHDELERLCDERKLTVLFVTHNVREAARLGDRIVVLSSRPGRVRETIDVDIPRPRRMDSPEVSELAGSVTEHPARGGASPCSLTSDDIAPASSARSSPVSMPSSWPPSNVGAAVARRIWSGRPGRRSPPSASCSGSGRRCRGSGGRSLRASPPPRDAFAELWEFAEDGSCGHAISLTMRRAAVGFLLSVVIGVIVGSLVSRVRLLRAAFGSLITGIQTMPSSGVGAVRDPALRARLEKAIMLVMVLGAAPSIANGLISGADHIPPVLLRAGRVLGAQGRVRVPPRHPARGDALVRRWPEAGVGVPLAQPDGRRTRSPRCQVRWESANCSNRAASLSSQTA